jgi:hypothetical protein
MEWLQVFTIIASTLGGVYVFFMITAERINRLEQFHREDMKSMESRFAAMESRFAAMDAKWERLFERLLVQDKKHG